MPALVLMYHYVRDHGVPSGFSTARFRHQVAAIKRRYEILTLSEAMDYRGNRDVAVLTFDDGLKDAAVNVAPILSELQARAVFFVTTATLDGSTILNVQKRHLLLNRLRTEAFASELNVELPALYRIEADERFRADYLDDLLTCSLKWMLDFGDGAIVEPALDLVFSRHFPDQRAVFSQFYLTDTDCAALLADGHEIGCHGHSHRQLVS